MTRWLNAQAIVRSRYCSEVLIFYGPVRCGAPGSTTRDAEEGKVQTTCLQGSNVSAMQWNIGNSPDEW